MNSLLEDTIGCLQQAVDLISELPADLYTQSCPISYGSSVGGHFRHCLDHYQRFLVDLPTGRIDYDNRERDPQVEKQPHYAAAVLRGIIMGLEHIEEEQLDQPLTIKMESGSASEWSRSSIRRELQFLLSHSIHHFALLATILRFFNYQEIPPTFGVAPSTYQHQQS